MHFRARLRWRAPRLPLALLVLPLLSCAASSQEPPRLFDGRSLAGWEVADFIGSGDVRVDDGAIVLGRGDPMTGITWSGDFPRYDYELTLEAKRVAGNDFFSTITFPVRDDFCSLVVGGWGGAVVGLSSIEGADASENETRTYFPFEDDRWYRLRLRVSGGRIEAWIDDRPVVDFDHEGRLLSLRVEVMANRPFGIATWNTSGMLRELELRRLPAGGGT